MAKHFSRRSTIAAGFGALATATLAGCIGDSAANDPNRTKSATDGDAAGLYTAQDDRVGTVSVTQEGSQLTVSFETGDSPWTISEAHLNVGSTVSDIPRSVDGNPHVYQFDRVTRPVSPTDAVEFAAVTIEDDLEQAVVAGHAVVQRGLQTTEVWAGTEPIPDTADWARYFEHDLAASEPPISGVPGISGRIVQANGEPGTNDRLVYKGPEGADDPEYTSIYTDENGLFDTTVPEPGTYSLVYYQRERKNTSTPERDGSPDVYELDTVDVEDDVTELGTIELPESHVLDVRVVDETGTPIEGAPVNFYTESWGIGRRQTTNANGYFQHEGLNTTGIELLGNVRIQVWEPGVDPEPGNYTAQRRIELDGPRTEEFVLDGTSDDPEGTLELNGTIYEPGGEPATDGRISIRGPRHSNKADASFYRSSTDDNGDFDVEVEDPGSYVLGYFHRQYSSPERDGTPDIYHLEPLEVNGAVDLGDITLPQAHVLDVRVVDATGTPVEGASVGVWSCTSDFNSCWGSGSQKTNADGYFQYDGLQETGAELAEHVMVRVWHPDVDDPGYENVTEEREFELTESRTEEFVLDG